MISYMFAMHYLVLGDKCQKVGCELSITGDQLLQATQTDIQTH